MTPAGAAARSRTDFRAYFFAFAAMSLFCCEAAFARLLGPAIDLGQLMVIRATMQLAFLTLWLRGDFGAMFATGRAWLHLTRGVLSVTGLAAYFYVFATMPMTTATVVMFAGVLVTVFAARFVLGEAVGWQRAVAALVGFAGVALVVRPEATTISLSLLAAVYLVVNTAGITLATKDLARSEPTHVIMAWIATTMLATALPFALIWPTWPTPEVFLYMLGIGLCGTIGQFASVTAIRMADVSALAPVNYMRIVLASAIGYWLFGELLDWWSLIGAGIVTASALFITLHETRRSGEPER